jgi:hypothetical protein
VLIFAPSTLAVKFVVFLVIVLSFFICVSVSIQLDNYCSSEDVLLNGEMVFSVSYWNNEFSC